MTATRVGLSAMKLNHLILTHGAVFSIGIAAAMIANGLRPHDSEISGDGGGIESQARTANSNGRLNEGRAVGNAGIDQNGPETLSKKGHPGAVVRLQGIVRITDPFERQRALMDLVDSLGAEEFAAVADQFRELEHLSDSGDEYDLLLRGWAKADPLAALEYVGQHGNSRDRCETILSSWAGNDAAAAERWALDHHEGDGPNPYMAAVIQGIAGNDLATASRLAEAMPYSRERGQAIEAITRALLVQGTAAAMAYPASIADEALRGGFVAAIANRLAGKDPAQAAAWLASMGQGEVQSRAARTVAEALAKMDTRAAAEWLRTLKPEAQAEAARGIIPVMSASDISGTAQWVSSLVGTPNYDRVVEEFVWSCNSRAPEQSAAWIQGVTDPEQQRRLYHRMLGEWAQRDATAVKQWVTANNVPQDVLRRFSR